MTSTQKDKFCFIFLILEWWILSVRAQEDEENELVYDYIVGFGGLALGIISIMILIICICSKKGKGNKVLTPEEEEKEKRRDARKQKRTERQTEALAKSHFEQLGKK